MDLILDENGNVVLKDGCPVYKYEDGSESPFDAKKTLDAKDKKIADLTEEKTRFFTKTEALKSDLKKFKGIDIKVAAEAIETVKNLKSKELLDANGIKILKSEMLQGFETEKIDIKKGYDQQILDRDGIILSKDGIIKSLLITTQFANSPHFSGKNKKTIYPAEDAVKIFGDRFKVDESTLSIVALDKSGEVLKSQKTHGEPADFEEAIAKIIDEHPRKNEILNMSPGGPFATGNLGPAQKGDYGSPAEKIAAGLKRRHPEKFGT